MSDQDQLANPILESTTPKSKPLSPKQRVFVDEYLKCWNSSEACRRAGYKSKPNVHGPRLLANVSIKAEIDRRLEENLMEANEALNRLATQARGLSDMVLKQHEVTDIETDLVHEELYIDIDALREHNLLSLVKKVSFDKDGRQIIEFYDAQNALFKVLQHKGLLVKKFALTDPTGEKEWGLQGITPAMANAASNALREALQARDAVGDTDGEVETE